MVYVSDSGAETIENGRTHPVAIISNGDPNFDPISVSTGDRFEVYWPLMDQFYSGTVKNITDNHDTVNYNDGDVETLQLQQEIWLLPDMLSSLSDYFGSKLVSNEQEVIRGIMDAISNN